MQTSLLNRADYGFSQKDNIQEKHSLISAALKIAYLMSRFHNTTRGD
jgi:hypothetical protein